ncbi:MAG: ABC transporter permease, partial [bacterium]
TIRNKILSAIVAFTALMWVVSYIMSRWSIGEPVKILTDLGLTITSFGGVIIAIFSGIVLVWNEVDRKTILPLLAKPVSRGEYLVGKFIGFSCAVQVVYIGMSIVFLIFLWASGRTPSASLIAAIVFTMGEIEILIAWAVFFSTLTNPTLSAIFMIIIFIVGRLSEDLNRFLSTQEQSLNILILKGIYWVIPHLSLFNLRPYATYELAIEGRFIIIGFLYSLSYTLLLLFLAWKVFRERDLA